ncbi:lysophospholipid acyltransferase family protein [Halioxenophilus sp. WMMB6]|uniref:lysophospholipid acyltransferase family protein n=1 Tax=Halioxenophilus sp. WMMB6 TaxID=3073815 RepID=UPI00295EE9BC|nr:lysophospholipid acyltransferase family protein [Halioxenophilus sp. WMMB6]
MQQPANPPGRKQKRLAKRTNAGWDVKGRLLVVAMRLLSLFPFTMLRLFGHCLGRLLWALDIQAARVTRENLSYAYPELEEAARERLAKANMIASAETALEMAAVWFRENQWLRSAVVEVANEVLLERAQKAGRGVIVLAPHLGNWEVLGRYLGVVAPGTTVMYQPAQSPSVDAMIANARLRNVNIAAADRGGVAKVVKALKSGQVVGILPDQVPMEGAGEFADFYTKPALTMTMIHQLYKKHRSLMVMAYCERVKKGYRIVFAEPEPAIYAEEMAVALRGLNESVEACIDQIPSQYQWQYKRYRKQPPGVERPYRF